jgi:hypothetical protein
MYAKAISIVMTAAIIACPIWCGNGLCHDEEGCAAGESAEHCCPTHDSAPCCGGKSLPDENSNCPPTAPCELSCQGVCGGAVFEKPCELTGEMESSVLPLIADKTPVTCQTAERQTRDHDGFLRRGGNHGRALRTLHMSFLC